MESNVCVFASTKYQMINAIQIVLENKFQADLYIIDEGIYKDCDEIAERIKKEKIFVHITVIKTKKLLTVSRINHFINSSLCYLKGNKIVESYLISLNYETMLFCTGSLVERLTRFYFLKSRKPIHFYMFDEGVGSYLGTMEKIYTKADGILRRMLWGKEALNVMFDKFLYIPELYIHYGNDNYGKIRKISPIDVSSSRLQIFNRIFLYEPDMHIEEPLIFMDLNYKNFFVQDGRRRYETLIEKIAEVWKENIIIKQHPSSTLAYNSKIKYCKFSSIPFEIVCANSNVEDKIIISLCSTASVSAKILYDKEPVVILLYKLFEGQILSWNKYGEEFFLKIRERYRNKDRFIIPESQEELFEIFERLKLKRELLDETIY